MVTVQKCTDNEELCRLYEKAGIFQGKRLDAFVLREGDRALAACLFDRQKAELLAAIVNEGAPAFAAEAVVRAALGALERAGNKTALCRNAAMRSLILPIGFREDKDGALTISLPDFISAKGHCAGENCHPGDA